MFALSKCRFAPATTVKRFARSMGAELDHPHRTQPDGTPWPLSGITDRQAALLWKYCHHYRKQITDPYVLEEAEKRWTEHDWREPNETIKYPWCGKCLIIQRRDGLNGSCRGAERLREMEKMRDD